MAVPLGGLADTNDARVIDWARQTIEHTHRDAWKTRRHPNDAASMWTIRRSQWRPKRLTNISGKLAPEVGCDLG